MVTRYKAERLRPHYIKQWLEHLGISQAKLANLMGTDKANITRWIGNPERVNLDVLSGIADALLPFAPELKDAGNLLRHPDAVISIEAAREAATRFLDHLPTTIAEKRPP
jgi:transcriptional regulator with XRE-family HTH domain